VTPDPGAPLLGPDARKAVREALEAFEDEHGLRKSAEAALAEAMRIQRVQTNQLERVRRLAAEDYSEHTDEDGHVDRFKVFLWPSQIRAALTGPADDGGDVIAAPLDKGTVASVDDVLRWAAPADAGGEG